MFVGIDDISFHASDFYLSLTTLAQHNGQNPDKYSIGLGQYQMGIPSLDTDIVTMGANAAFPLVNNKETDKIRTILFATESGIDQSKAAGIYVHQLLGLHENIRVVELKQACYSATAALHMACALVTHKPDQEVLIIASDVARYGLNTPGEATQGCGAVAMLVKTNPRLLVIHPEQGCYSEDVMDFWRPNYMDTALVDGKYSTQVYMKALRHSWKNYLQCGGRPYADIFRFCYHLPFGKMGEKAHRKLAITNNAMLSTEEIHRNLESMLYYNQYIGNSYSASLYISLISLLENEPEDLSNKTIGMFSYGSGCVSEFFSMTPLPEYRQLSRQRQHMAMLSQRAELSYDEYTKIFTYEWPVQGEEIELPCQTRGRYRLAAIKNHQRIYQQTAKG